MEYSEDSIRGLIRRTLTENFKNLLETQRGKQIDYQKEELMSSLNIFLSDNLPDEDIIMKEVETAIEHKINKVLQSSYEYPDFYIVKLGGFVFKNNEGTQPLAFTMEGVNKNFTFPYLYIYHDTAIALKFGSKFFDSNEMLIKEAKRFIEDNSIQLNTMHETGNEIIVDDRFDSDNVIDFKDYSKARKPQQKEKVPALASEKASYRAGAKVNHPKFGKGTIQKTKRHSIDDDGNAWYNVTVDFDGDIKTLRMKEN